MMTTPYQPRPPRSSLFLLVTLLLGPSDGYDMNGVKKFPFGDTVGIDAPGDSSESCAFRLTRGRATCCYSCDCQSEPCACGPGLERDPGICDGSHSDGCREGGYNVTRVSTDLCILFLHEFTPKDAGSYQVTVKGGITQRLPIIVEGVASKKERMDNGFLVETALNSDISISAMGRLDGGCGFLFTSKDGQRT